METTDILFSALGNQVRDLTRNVNNVLRMLLPNEGDEIRLNNNDISEDYSFMDYDGKTYMFAGFKRGRFGISLLGIIYNECVEVPTYNYDFYSLMEMVVNYNRILEDKREKEENEND